MASKVLKVVAAGQLQRCFIAPRTTRLLYTKSESKEKLESSKTTHFGFESVQEDKKVDRVYQVFEKVAETYDMMNDAMSGGVHRLWKDAFIERLGPTSGTKLIDVAGGTGDIAFRFLDYVNNNSYSHDTWFDIKTQEFGVDDESSSSSSSEDETHKDTSHVTVCDINQAMLDIGQQRATKHWYAQGISWLKGNAECLPLADDSFDAYTIAFGIRNTTHIDKVLTEARRVLKPGGRFLCLEFSRVNNPLLRGIYDQYSFQVIPVMGQLIARDWKSYQYLVESIRNFPTQEDFAAMIREAGFHTVRYENLTFGVAAIHSGFKL